MGMQLAVEKLWSQGLCSTQSFSQSVSQSVSETVFHYMKTMQVDDAREQGEYLEIRGKGEREQVNRNITKIT
jgi:hypothetical protein